MNEAALVIGALLIACVLYGVFLLGRVDGRADLDKVKADLVTERAVRHNLNCLVGDLKAEVKKNKADAHAYHTCVGLWATDQPNLIKHHIHRERFFRIGYPEHKL